MPEKAPEDEPLPSPSRRQKLRAEALNQTLGRWVRVIDLLLEHHTDAGLPVEKEAAAIAKRASILMVEHLMTEEDIVLLLESSRMRLPQSLEESTAHDIRAWIDGHQDPDDDLELRHRDDDPPSVLPEGGE
jgi:hypothetical protein